MISSERNPFSLRDTLKREHDEKYKHDNAKMSIIIMEKFMHKLKNNIIGKIRIYYIRKI